MRRVLRRCLGPPPRRDHDVHVLLPPEGTDPMTADWHDLAAKEPEAHITQTGRWTYSVYISHGLTRYGPDGYGWHVLGAKRAAWKADRELARYRRRKARLSNVTVRR